MRALVLARYGKMEVREIPVPVPAADEALVRTGCTGICGSDVHGFTGENGRRVPGQVMGHESVGVVADIGEAGASSGLSVGDRVTFNPVVIPANLATQYEGREQHCPTKYVIGVQPDRIAAFAELMPVPLRNLVPFPGPAPMSHGALVEPLAVAVHAIRRSHVQPGVSAAVVGGGPIGQSVVLALIMAGVRRIVVSEVDPQRRALLADLGAVPVDPTVETLCDAVVTRFGSQAQVGVDAVGSTGSLDDALSATQAGGTVTLVGMQEPRIELDAYAVSTQERVIVGSFTYSARDFADAATWMRSESETAAKLISRVVPLDEAPDAFADIAHGRSPAGKVLVRFD